jgi:RNA polymerase sigma-70 factor (ECF subfamily)
MVVVTTAKVSEMTKTTDFDVFYRSEHAPLYRALAMTLGDSDLAAEAIDEAMVRAYQRWAVVSRYDNPAGWVYRVALNWAISRLRLRRRTLPAVQAAADELRLPDPVLAEAVKRLSTSHRAVVVLRFHLDWSLEQIAAALGVPVGTVKSRLHRALSSLRETLGGDHES